MTTNWFDGLENEDSAFIRRFILASGSLKEVAKIYGISYPTVRLRLDRLIAKIKVLDDSDQVTAFERTLRSCLADGRIDEKTMAELRQAHETQEDEGVGDA